MGFAMPFREAFRDDDRRRSFPVPVLTPSPAQIVHTGEWFWLPYSELSAIICPRVVA
jgi:hypothetical protein